MRRTRTEIKDGKQWRDGHEYEQLKRTTRSNAAYKRRVERHGRAVCEVCNWRPPAIDNRAFRMLHVHHIVPLSCGGLEEESNVIILCPNHHATTHYIWRGHYRKNATKHWAGPSTKMELIEELHQIDADVENWSMHAAARIAEMLDAAIGG